MDISSDKLQEANKKLRKRLSELVTIFDIAKTFSSINDEEELCSLIINTISTVVRVERVSLLLLDKNEGELRIAASLGLDKDVVRNTRLKLGEKISGWVAEKGEPLLIEDIEKDPAFKQRSNERYYTRSLLTVPLKAEGEVIGVLNVNNKFSKGIFTSDDLRIVSVVANQAAVIIRNIQLHREITERTRMLVEADRMVSLGFLSAGIAHEINNPNTFIRTNLQTFKKFWGVVDNVLEENKSLPEQTRERIDFIRREMPYLIAGMAEGTDRIVSIVRDVGSFTRRKVSGRMEPLDIREPIKKALRLVENRLKQMDVLKKEEFEDEGSFLIMGESLSLSQVFVNLFNNAIDAMRGAELRELSILLKKKKGQVVVVIKDTGEGIKNEDIKKVFDPFYTTKRAESAGLGLFISQGIIREHLGKIEAESVHNEGARFIISMPEAESSK